MSTRTPLGKTPAAGKRVSEQSDLTLRRATDQDGPALSLVASSTHDMKTPILILSARARTDHPADLLGLGQPAAGSSALLLNS